MMGNVLALHFSVGGMVGLRVGWAGFCNCYFSGKQERGGSVQFRGLR